MITDASLFLNFIFISYVYACVSLSGVVFLSADVHRRKKRMSDPLDLE